MASTCRDSRARRKLTDGRRMSVAVYGGGMSSACGGGLGGGPLGGRDAGWGADGAAGRGAADRGCAWGRGARTPSCAESLCACTGAKGSMSSD